MDLELSDDIEESFKKFQGLIYKEYKKMKDEFVVIDATKPPEEQQRLVRAVVESKIDLKRFKKKDL
jgi:thymidylate kinase